MTLLTIHELDEVIEAAIAEGFAEPERRRLLLGGLPDAITTSLPDCRRPADQLRSDVRELARLPPATGEDAHPLGTWLHTAAGFAHDPRRREVFLRIERRLQPPAAEGAPPPADPERRPGMLFDGRYVLRELLSDAVYTQVWRAQLLGWSTESGVSAAVVLKMLKPSFEQHPDIRRRFLRGITAMLAVNDRHMAQPIGRGTPDSPHCYYVMEYLRGGTLEAALIRGELSCKQGLSAVFSVARVLQKAHEQRLLHRDFKPSNILLDQPVEPDESVVAKLIDFDLVRSAEGGGTRSVGGTWGYVAPEARGSPSRVSVLSDVYSVSRTLLFVLYVTAIEPEERASLPERWPALSDDEILRRLLCSTEVVKVAQSATSVDPRQRPRSVRELLDELSEAMTERNLGRRFELQGRAVRHRHCKVYDAIDLGAAPDTRREVQVTVFSPAASRRLEALSVPRIWTSLQLDLHHESIPVIRARGRDRHGCCWLATERDGESEGENLGAALDQRPPDPGLDALPRRVWAVCRALRVVSYAHRRGIVHRDLRLAHIWVSATDRVVLGGWATAIQRGETADASGVELDVESAGWMLVYLLIGKAAGDPPDFMIDGHALQVTLPMGALRGACISKRELWAIGSKARSAGYPSMDELIEALDEWMARVRARHAFEALQPMLDEHRHKLAQARALERAALLAQDSVHPWDPEPLKHRWWADEDRARMLRQEAEASEQLWWRSMIGLSELLPEARERFEAVVRDRLVEADDRGDRDRVRRLETLAGVHFGPAVLASMSGRRSVTIDAQGVDADVVLEQFDLDGRRAQATARETLGRRDWFDLTLAPASYALVYTCHGRVVRYPFVITRRGQRPDPLRLPVVPNEGLGTDDVFVAAGECLIGGDPLAPDGLSARRIEVDAFFIQRHPVTHGAYVEFLNAVWRQGAEVDARRFAPRVKQDGALLPAYVVGPDGFTLDPASPVREATPVTRIDWQSAGAYADWLAAQTGLPWRLPHDVEWEKAARGVDGRLYPWGNRGDPSWANMTNSHRDQAHVIDVDVYEVRFPVDVSPYGVPGLGGNVQTWCRNRWRPSGPCVTSIHGRARLIESESATGDSDEFIVTRGGSYLQSVDFCRSSGRFVGRPGDCQSPLGLRLVRSLSPSELQE